MRTWEYLDIYVKDGAWYDSIGRDGHLEEHESWEVSSPAALLNQLGLEGWELVGVLHASGDYPEDRYRLFLKRPRT